MTVLQSDRLTTGPAVEAFERKIESVCGKDTMAVACSSGTAALHLATATLDLEPGDQVVVPSLTFLATANAVRFAGGEVLFADVDSDSGLLRVDDVLAAVRRSASPDKVRAIIVVHLAGQCADLAELSRLCNERDWVLIEDASHAIGGTYEAPGTMRPPEPVGSCGHSTMCTFSFHPVKTVTSAEGGAVTTRDDRLAARLRSLRNHGMTRNPDEFENRESAFRKNGEAHTWYYEMHALMPNYRLSDVHAALGCSQLDRLNEFVERRNCIVDRYDRSFEELAHTAKPVRRLGHGTPAWHLYPLLIDFETLGKDRDTVISELASKSIGSQVHYFPVHRQPYYRKRYGDLDLPGSNRYYDRELSLPLYPSMSEDDISRVIDGTREVSGGV